MKSKFWFPLLALLLAVPAFAQVSDTYVIPAAGDGPGLNGSRWATEFHLFNPQPHALRVTLTFLPTGGALGTTVKFNVPANGTAYANNILDEVFELSGYGSLLVATFAADNPTVPDRMVDRAFVVNSRTYNTSSSGTFGQAIPGGFYGLQDFESDGITGIATGIRNTSSGSSGFRTNVGAVNLGRYSVTMWVTVYDAAGRRVQDSIPFTLPPQAHVQGLLPIAVDHGSLEFEVDDSSQDAVVFPYASVIDNRTNDPIYVSPVLLATPSRLIQSTAVAKNAVAPTPRRIGNSEAARVAASARAGSDVVINATGAMRPAHAGE